MNEEMIGKKYGRWTVIGTTDDKRRVRCVCECGKERDVIKSNLKNGDSKSCGCYNLEQINKRTVKHGGKKTRLYAIWCSMRRRCNNKNDKNYPRYGKRGIRVCDEWNDFVAFRDWMLEQGYDEKSAYGEQTIDRIDNNGNYTPDNCRIATIKQQNSNRSSTRKLTYNGLTLSMAEWGRKMGYHNERVIGDRIRNGWSVEKAITTPPRKLTKKVIGQA